MENDKITMDQAVELFDQQQYREAFAAFAEIYNRSQDENERKVIFEMLVEAFYAPNTEDLHANYNKNCSLLANYPYQWGFQKCFIEDLPVQIFPVTETEYCLFDKQRRTFSELRVINSGQLCDYLFRDLSRPIFRENDCNLYHLQYLEDNVRRSEDYGGDNHIYLYYADLGELAPLLLLGELEPLLNQKKPVFLIGEENKKRYPIDFKKEFQIDYASMGPTPVRIEEIKRICFWYKHSHSGSVLSLATLALLNEVQMSMGYYFHTYSRIDGEPILLSEKYEHAVVDIDAVYTADQVSEMLQPGKSELVLKESDQISETLPPGTVELALKEIADFVKWLRRHRPAPYAYTVKELFCGYFLFRYEKRNLNPRIAPMLLYDPHMWDPGMYSNIVLSFPYRTALTCVREPIMTFIRNQQLGLIGFNTSEITTKYVLSFDYAHAQFLHPDLRPDYYGFRFEDLKAKPEVVCRALCRHLNLPYDKVMLTVDAPDSRGNAIVRGFDTAPLKWDISACLSDFDKIRLQMFYEPIQRYYGYPTFSFEEHPLPENVVRELFKYPFRFESANPQIHGDRAPSQEVFHSWIQYVLQNAWRKEFISPKLIPLEEPDEQEQEMYPQGMSVYKGNRQSRRAKKKRKK